MNIASLSRALVPVLLLVSLGVLAPAHARISGPRLTSHAIVCGALQDEYDLLLYEYRQSSTTYERRVEILKRLIEIGHSWYPVCSDVYGEISREDDTNACGGKSAAYDPLLCDPIDAVNEGVETDKLRADDPAEDFDVDWELDWEVDWEEPVIDKLGK